MEKFTKIQQSYKPLKKKQKKTNLLKENQQNDYKRLVEQERTEVSKFLSKLFESREMAHIYHLQVKGDEGSYAEHKALQEYYENIVDLVDDVIEVYQGQYGIVEGYEIIDTETTTQNMSSLDYFLSLGNTIMQDKFCIDQRDTHIHGLIDDIVTLVYKTIYKLKFNK